MALAEEITLFLLIQRLQIMVVVNLILLDQEKALTPSVAGPILLVTKEVAQLALTAPVAQVLTLVKVQPFLLALLEKQFYLEPVLLLLLVKLMTAAMPPVPNVVVITPCVIVIVFLTKVILLENGMLLILLPVALALLAEEALIQILHALPPLVPAPQVMSLVLPVALLV